MAKAITDLELELCLLTHLATAGPPKGATALALELGADVQVSQATIGRKLMALDARGLTRRESNRGRVLTEAGDRRRRELAVSLQKTREHANLLVALKVTDLKTLLDVLVARRALERETAGLAASRATAREVAALRRSIAVQERTLAGGIVPDDEDHRFHNLIATASGNLVLRHALNLVRTESLYSHYVAVMRHRVGGRLIEDHRSIVNGIASGSVQAAEKAMEQHIGKLIEDVQAYFELQGPGPDGLMAMTGVPGWRTGGRRPKANGRSTAIPGSRTRG